MIWLVLGAVVGTCGIILLALFTVTAIMYDSDMNDVE